jgi:hypothetical protein
MVPSDDCGKPDAKPLSARNAATEGLDMPSFQGLLQKRMQSALNESLPDPAAAALLCFETYMKNQHFRNLVRRLFAISSRGWY